MRKIYFTSQFLIAFVALSQAQVGINTQTPHESSALEVKSENKGLLIPRMTILQRNEIKNPAIGLIIFNIDNKCLEYHSGGGKWKNVCGDEIGYIGNLSSCRAILEKYGDKAKDREYLLTDRGSGKKFKTYCDMTNGGYTLIWSYSEKTAFNEYDPGSMYVSANYGFRPADKYNRAENRQIGFNFPQVDGVKYENFRVSRAVMEQIGFNSVRVHVTENPKKPNEDQHAKDNYAESSGASDFFTVNTPGVGFLNTEGHGKIEGRKFRVGLGYYRGTIEGINYGKPISQFFWVQASTWPLHINIDGSHSSWGIPYGLSQNLFGLFAIGLEGSKTNIFGDCPYSRPFCTAIHLVVSKENRHIQWFLK